MIYKFAGESLVPFVDFAAGALIYTVPTPTGKPAGVSGDGRLHLVQLRTVNDLILAGDIVYLRYRDDTGGLIATMPIFQAAPAFSGGVLIAMTGEPTVVVQVD